MQCDLRHLFAQSELLQQRVKVRLLAVTLKVIADAECDTR